MTDELKQWEYDKGYDKGKAEMLKVIEDIKIEISEYEKTCKVWSANQLKDDVKRCTSCINGTFGRINEIFDRHLGSEVNT